MGMIAFYAGLIVGALGGFLGLSLVSMLITQKAMPKEPGRSGACEAGRR
jgi:hypothetical protein